EPPTGRPSDPPYVAASSAGSALATGACRRSPAQKAAARRVTARILWSSDFLFADSDAGGREAADDFDGRTGWARCAGRRSAHRRGLLRLLLHLSTQVLNADGARAARAFPIADLVRTAQRQRQRPNLTCERHLLSVFGRHFDRDGACDLRV